MEAAFPFPSTLHWSWRALHRDHGQAVLCLQELLGVTPQGREGAPLLPPVLRAKKPHPHPPQPPSQTSPPPWKLGSVPHSGVYASLATLKTIPKTDKKDKKTKKTKKKKKASSRPCLLCADGTEPPCPGTGAWQHPAAGTVPVLQPCRGGVPEDVWFPGAAAEVKLGGRRGPSPQPHSCSRGGLARAGFMSKPCYRGGCSCTFWVLWTRDRALGLPRAPGAGEGLGGQAENNGQSFYYCE